MRWISNGPQLRTPSHVRAFATLILLASGLAIPEVGHAQVTIAPDATAFDAQIVLLNAGADGAPTGVLFDSSGTVQAPTAGFTEIMGPFTVTAPTTGVTINGATGATLPMLTLDPGATGAVRFEEIFFTNGNIEVQSGALEYVLDANDASYDGILSGAGGLTKRGERTLTLGGQNTYSGDTSVAGGTLIVGETSPGNVALPVGQTVDVAAGATLQFAVDTADSIYSGQITGNSDTAAIRKTGSAVLRLEGSNAYSAPTFVDGGTLELQNLTAGGATFGASPVTVASGATLQLNQGGTDGAIFAGSVAGDGTLTKLGGQSVRLTGGHTVANTNVMAGDLSLQDVPGATGSVNVGAGSTFHLRSTLADGTPSFTGAVNGTSSFFEINGDDSLAAATSLETQSFSGSVADGVTTTVSAGTLRLTGDASFGANGINVLPAGTVEFAQSGPLTFSDVISGGGSLSKTGAGQLFLGGAQSYTLNTTVSGGGLFLLGGSSLASAVEVRSGATLGGIGTVNNAVTVRSGGRLAPGLSVGTLTVNALTLDAGSVLEVEVDGATSVDRVAVTGAANLDGGDVAISIDPAAIVGAPLTANQVFVNGESILSAASITGSGLTVSNPSFFFDAALATVGSDVQLTVTRNANTFATAGTSTTQRSIGPVFDGITSGAITATGELAAVAGSLLAGTGSVSVPDSLDLLSGEVFTLIPTVQRSIARQFGDTLLRRGTARTRRAQGVALMPAEYRFRADLPSVQSGAREFGVGDFDGWYEGFVHGTELDDYDSRDLEIFGGGGTFGVDASPMPGVVAGLALGYVRTTAELDGLDIDFDANTVQTGLYAAYAGDRLQLAGLFRYAWTGSKTERDIAIGAVDRTAKAELDGHQVGIHLNGALDLPIVGALRAQPNLGLAWDHLIGDDVNESGAGTLDLRSDGEALNSVVTTLGLRLTGSFLMDPFTTFTPYVESSFAHEFGDAERELDFQFASTPSAGTFKARGAAVPRNSWRGGVGWDVLMSSGLVLSAGYDIDLASGFIEHTGRLGVEFRW